MRIGITVLYQHSFFSAGSPQTALALAEVFHLSGHTVSFLNVYVPTSKETPPATWWDDVQTLKKEWKTVQLEELDTATEPPFDFLLEIGSHILKPEQRKKAAKTSVWVCRKPALMSDIESSLFPFLTQPERNLDGVKGVWVFDAMTTPDDIEYLEVQTRLPVQVIPFVWTPSALELHRQSTQAPVWPQVASHPDIVKANRPWEFHVCETNTSSTSSCTIPLFIAAELKKKKKSIHASHKVIIHNADNIRHGEFFQKNVFEKMFSDISGEFVGRMRCADLVYAPMSCVLAHSRFLQIRPYLLDCLWVGVPTLHNSPFLRDKFGDSVFHKYYPDNEITKGYSALEQLLQSSKQTETTKALEQLMETRKTIMSLVAPFSPVVQKGITDALQTLLTSSFTQQTTVATAALQQQETKTLPGIDQIWLINLDRRQDRLEKFYATHPDLKGSVTRLPAFDGKQLKLTDRLARLFVPNDFKWKKPVMGCALSHLAIWMNLLSQENQNKAFLVLEDDVVLQKGWQDRWTSAWNAKAIPDNWDVLYLGGLLPPNRAGFEAAAVEKINAHVGRVKEHTLFGPQPRRYMHFCNYAYVLSRRGAEKVVEFMKAKGGVWTSGDHLICNLFEILNIYFLHPLPAGCYQDNDPVYCNSAFNDFSRKDNFDSDLWTNNEHFSEDEVKEALVGKVLPLDVLGALEDARKTVSVPPLFGTAEGKSKSAPASLEEHPLAPIRIGFCDMWADFNAECNQFLAIVQDVLKEKGNRNIKGFDLESMTPGQEAVDLVVFGPFGQRWRSVQEGIPLVFYTGENSPPPRGDPRVKLTLGFDRKAFSIRLPLWMLEINWFGLNPDEVRNPKPFPLDLATKPQISEREKFCAFVVSNPCQEKRNTAFHWLHAYKPIDSAGRLFNNVGSDIFAGLGGGGGELKKIEFFRKYKFALTYENAESPGYCTEKMLHAKVAGCIPIYWGDPEVEEDFDVRGFIDARQVKSAEELIQKVKEVETNKYLYHEMRSIPALDTQREAKARAVLREVGEKMLGLIKQTSKNTNTVHVSPNNTVFVTAASQAFLPSLQLWLQSVTAQKQANPQMQIHVYCMTDISDGLLAQYKESFPLAIFHRFPTDAPAQFPDLWAPQHFAWKLWIYKTFVQKEEFRGKLIFYFDSGAMLVRYPKAWMTQVAEQGLVMLDDESQINRTWCHAEFRKALSVSKEELDAHQIWAGGMAFVGGHPLPRAVFEEAWKWGQNRDIIVGAKEYPVDERVDGCQGHRHDQSILSIVSMRHKVPRISLNTVHNHVSLRLTYLTGACIYVHRGNFSIHKPLITGIDNAWVINLDRCTERMQRFKDAHPDLLHEIIRQPAYEDGTLQLTPKLARLFAPNDFYWNKTKIVSAMSHLDLWMKLVNDKPDIQSYLVLDDGVVLNENWSVVWKTACTTKAIPEDWDIACLGGGMDNNCLEKLNMYVSRVKQGGKVGKISYAITRKGALKVLEALKARGGFTRHVDEFLLNLYDSLNIYVFHPHIATVQNNSVEKDDRFSNEDIATALQHAPAALDIDGALQDAAKTPITQPVALPTTKEKPHGRRIVTVAGGPWNAYETQWLRDLMGYDFPIENLSATATTDIPEDQPIVLFQRPHWDAIRAVLEKWRAKGVCFFLLHLSDEWCKDPIDIYSWKECLGVIRNYVRADCPNSDKVKTIPIGYHWKAKTNPSAAERSLTWSFAGTGWKDRDQKMKVLQDIIPTTDLHLQKGWESDDKLSEEKMLALYERSMCIPCPGGQNPETFRVYEALEAGAIPVLVKEEGNTSYLAFLNTWLPLLHCENWDHAGKLIQTLKAKPEVYEQYRQHVLDGWKKMKVELQGWVRCVFRV